MAVTPLHTGPLEPTFERTAAEWAVPYDTGRTRKGGGLLAFLSKRHSVMKSCEGIILNFTYPLSPK